MLPDNYDAIPGELKAYNQWVVWRFEMRDGRATKVPYSPITANHAKVNDPETWGTFQEAIDIARNPNNGVHGIGFMLTPEDPYVFIDLDDPMKMDHEGMLINDDAEDLSIAQDVHNRIYLEFDSYSELSPSGKGLHIICKVNRDKEGNDKMSIMDRGGARRDVVEMYASGRFMTMTGNVVQGKDQIYGRVELVRILYKQLKNKGGTRHRAFDFNYAETLTDDEVVQRAINASNGEKFRKLYEGQWAELEIGDGSQSSADIALINMLVYYTPVRSQVRRIFIKTPMYRPHKNAGRANGRDYIDITIDRAFDREELPIDTEALRQQWEEIQANMHAPEPEAVSAVPQETIQQQPEQQVSNMPKLVGADVDPMPAPVGITKPPGLIGDIADYIYASAPRPVPEIALAGAMALMAGICGRAYNISNTGLNQYLLLLAPTGTGKEAISSGMSRLIHAVNVAVPGANKYIGPSKFSSAPALMKHLSDQSNSFVSVFGEFGMYMGQMSGDKAAGYMVELRRAMLDLFNKSGRGQVLQSSVYSDSAKNASSITSPAFSFIGESTPLRFYETLTEDLISEGFLPRLTIIEYNGERVGLNHNHATVQIPQSLLQRLQSVIIQAQLLNAKNTPHAVSMEPDAEAMANEFDRACDKAVNAAGDNEVSRQLWTRAHVKSLKLAGLVAVGIDQYRPMVTPTIMQWAIDVATQDVMTIIGRFERGEIGNGVSEEVQEREVIEVFTWWNTTPVEDLGRHGVTYAKARAAHILPHRVLSMKLSSKSAFKRDRRGPADALRGTLRIMQEKGLVTKPSPQQCSDAGVPEGACYLVSDPKLIMPCLRA